MSEERKFYLNGVEVTEEEMLRASEGTEKQEVEVSESFVDEKEGLTEDEKLSIAGELDEESDEESAD